MAIHIQSKQSGKNDRGFIKYVIIIIIAILILSYFGFDIKKTAESDAAKSNFGYVWGSVQHFWDAYLATPAKFIWDRIFVGIVWNMIIQPSLSHIGQIGN